MGRLQFLRSGEYRVLLHNHYSQIHSHQVVPVCVLSRGKKDLFANNLYYYCLQTLLRNLHKKCKYKHTMYTIKIMYSVCSSLGNSCLWLCTILNLVLSIDKIGSSMNNVKKMSFIDVSTKINQFSIFAALCHTRLSKYQYKMKYLFIVNIFQRTTTIILSYHQSFLTNLLQYLKTVMKLLSMSSNIYLKRSWKGC